MKKIILLTLVFVSWGAWGMEQKYESVDSLWSQASGLKEDFELRRLERKVGGVVEAARARPKPFDPSKKEALENELSGHFREAAFAVGAGSFIGTVGAVGVGVLFRSFSRSCLGCLIGGCLVGTYDMVRGLVLMDQLRFAKKIPYLISDIDQKLETRREFRKNLYRKQKSGVYSDLIINTEDL